MDTVRPWRRGLLCNPCPPMTGSVIQARKLTLQRGALRSAALSVVQGTGCPRKLSWVGLRISISDPSINPLGELRPGPSAFLFGHCPLLPALCLVTKKQAACNWKRTSRLGKGRRLGQKLYAWVFLPWANSYCKIIALFKKHALQVHSMHSFW